MQAVAHFVETFVPEHYEVFLDLSRKTKTFSGRDVYKRQSLPRRSDFCGGRWPSLTDFRRIRLGD